jgi:hypothetical protein
VNNFAAVSLKKYTIFKLFKGCGYINKRICFMKKKLRNGEAAKKEIKFEHPMLFALVNRCKRQLVKSSTDLY